MSVAVETWTDPEKIGAHATGHLIDGRWQPAGTGETFPVFDPGTGQVIAEAARGNADDCVQILLWSKNAMMNANSTSDSISARPRIIGVWMRGAAPGLRLMPSRAAAAARP